MSSVILPDDSKLILLFEFILIDDSSFRLIVDLVSLYPFNIIDLSSIIILPILIFSKVEFPLEFIFLHFRFPDMIIFSLLNVTDVEFPDLITILLFFTYNDPYSNPLFFNLIELLESSIMSFPDSICIFLSETKSKLFSLDFLINVLEFPNASLLSSLINNWFLLWEILTVPFVPNFNFELSCTKFNSPSLFNLNFSEALLPSFINLTIKSKLLLSFDVSDSNIIPFLINPFKF